MSGHRGPTGLYGPNDYGYMHRHITNAATELKKAQDLFSQGHYPHSNTQIIPHDHPLRKAMEMLSELDVVYAKYANKEPNPELFSTYEPPYEDTIRWDNSPTGEI